MTKPIGLLLPITCLLLACIHHPSARNPAFANPEQLVNLSTQVCGYMIDSSNIVESRDPNDASRRGGLSIAASGPLDPLHRGLVCVEGQIVYIGCETGPVACVDIAFDYGIRIQRVVPRSERR